MKKPLIISLLLMFCLYLSVSAQQLNVKPLDADKMIPGMTEIMDPEVKIIQPGTDDGYAPSDAIVLFNGEDINMEWEDSHGNPSMWVVD